MSVAFDKDSECGLVYGSLIEFIKCWENGANSRLVLETCNGQAWVNLNCCLGRPFENNVVPARRKPRRQQDKNLRRAAEHKQKIDSDTNDVTAEAIVPVNEEEEIMYTVDIWVNVITNDKLDVRFDTNEVKKLSESVGQCVVKEINEDFEYALEADYQKGSIVSCGQVENDAFMEGWEYQLKFRVKINNMK